MRIVADDIRRGSLRFALVLLIACLVRLGLEPVYAGLRFAVLPGALLAYALIQMRVLRAATPARIRGALLANFLAINLGYVSIGVSMNAAHGWRADPWLYRADCFLFHGDPQALLSAWHAPWLSTACILGYISFIGYLAYLFLAEGFTLSPFTGRLQLALMTLYAVGFSGYLLFPAAGPVFFHPAPLPDAAQTAFSAYFDGWVRRCCSHVDVFPSLHAAVATFVQIWAWRRHRAAFWCLLPLTAFLLLGAVYFQYHYFTDILVGLPLGAGFGLCAIRTPQAAPAQPAEPPLKRSVPAAAPAR